MISFMSFDKEFDHCFLSPFAHFFSSTWASNNCHCLTTLFLVLLLNPTQFEVALTLIHTFEDNITTSTTFLIAYLYFSSPYFKPSHANVKVSQIVAHCNNLFQFITNLDMISCNKVCFKTLSNTWAFEILNLYVLFDHANLRQGVEHILW